MKLSKLINKNKKTIFIGFLIIAGLAVMAYFAFKPFSAVEITRDYTLSSNLYSSSPISYTYKIAMNEIDPLNSPPNCNARSEWIDFSFPTTIYYNGASRLCYGYGQTIGSCQMPLGLDLSGKTDATISGHWSQFFNAEITDIKFSAVADPCSSYSRDVSNEVQIKNLTSKCAVVIVGDYPPEGTSLTSTAHSWRIDCQISGKVAVMENANIVPSSIYNILSINMNLEVLKKNIACTPTQTTFCPEGYGCSNNQCMEFPKIYYRVSNGACIQTNLLFSQKTSADFNTLLDCQNNLNQITIQQNIQTINLLNLTLSQQANTINSYNISIQEKAKIITNLRLTLENQSALISQLTLSSQEKAVLIEQLTASLNQQIILIKNLNSTIQEKAQIIANMYLTIQQQASMIDALTANLQEKAYLVSQLQATNEKQAQLIAELKNSFSEQGIIIDNLGKKVEDDAIIIKNMNVSLIGQAQIILELSKKTDVQAQIIKEMNQSIQNDSIIMKNLNLNLDNASKLIVELKLSLEEENSLISNYTAQISTYQSQLSDKDALITKVNQEKENLKNEIITRNIAIAVLVAVIIILILVMALRRRKRR